MTQIFDKYIGQAVRTSRQKQGVRIADMAKVLFLSEERFLAKEKGEKRFFVSELFDLKRIFNIPLEPFFTKDGECLSNVGPESHEIADLIHYFDNINSFAMRSRLLNDVREASNVF